MICISEKDADYISNYLRKRLSSIKDSEERVTQVLKANGVFSQNSMNETTNRLTTPIYKCLEILMAGSDKTESNWRSLEEDPPQKGDRVLFAIGKFVFEGYLNDANEVMRNGFEASSMFEAKPTNWQPLPKGVAVC